MDEKGKKLVNARFKLEHAVTTPFTHWEEVPLAPDRTNANGQLEVDSLNQALSVHRNRSTDRLSFRHDTQTVHCDTKHERTNS